MSKQYPVVLFVFKRPSTTKIFLDLIALASIEKIYIFADGPRDREEEVLTSQVKNITQQFASSHKSIQMITKFSDHNIGLKNTFIDGLNSVFQKETAAIILEDDCLPTPDFFKFTASMLTKYYDQPKVMSIAGTSIGSFNHNSYDFSRYQLCWGWATWARAWKLYDPHMKLMGSPVWKNRIFKITKFPHMRWYWNMMLSIVKSGWLNTWDYQWAYSLFISDGLAIIPKCNLVSNIGFDKAATNTLVKSNVSNMATSSLKWPLTHPKEVIDNSKLSESIEHYFYNNPIAILGMLRQYFYWKRSQYAHRY